jgi:hypothetical protein
MTNLPINSDLFYPIIPLIINSWILPDEKKSGCTIKISKDIKIDLNILNKFFI